MRSALALALALCLGGAAGAAQATLIPLNNSFDVTIWHASCSSSCGSTNAMEQADNTNSLLSTTALGNYTYTGDLNFLASQNNILNFFNSGGGSLVMNSGATVASLGGVDLSTGGFHDTTLMRITGILSNSIGGILRHDDGATLNQGSNTFGSAAPTSPTDDPYTLNAGAFTLYYVEANSLPATLVMNVDPTVPEPSSLALIAISLLGLGLVAKRKRSSV